jgi:hypothetical protein
MTESLIGKLYDAARAYEGTDMPFGCGVVFGLTKAREIVKETRSAEYQALRDSFNKIREVLLSHPRGAWPYYLDIKSLPSAVDELTTVDKREYECLKRLQQVCIEVL